MIYNIRLQIDSSEWRRRYDRYSFPRPPHTYTHEQLLEPLEAHVARGHDDVRDIEHFPSERVGGGRGDVERAVPHGVRTGTEPHVLEHLHH